MVTERISVPDEVIKKIGDVLERPVMRRRAVEREIMTKSFAEKQRAFDQRIIANERSIIPDQLAGEGREVDCYSKDDQEKTPHPIGPRSFENAGGEGHRDDPP